MISSSLIHTGDALGRLKTAFPSGLSYRVMLLLPVLMKAGAGVVVGCGEGVAAIVAVGRAVLVDVGVGMNAVGVGG